MAHETEGAPGHTRRTVMRATAWTAPAVAVAAAAPAFASSAKNDIKNVTYEKFTEGTQGQDGAFIGVRNVRVTNDGPNVLAVNTVTLRLRIPPGGIFLYFSATFTDPWSTEYKSLGTNVFEFTYGGTIAVGDSVLLQGSVKITPNSNTDFDALVQYVGPIS